ncbi:MBOAT family O-acyltransferase [Candidatus Merdisoma sp. JLR.KK011]|uniref:MBOAT family O-acyltransferase n=1 Tax=Candidatus Merdisoma sp. JLR.KK011 TaxID=3114299 RepID=UPI002FF102B1
MLFNSYIFVLVFLPLCMIGYFGCSHFGKGTYGQVFLLGMSLWFYGYFHVEYLFIIVFSILCNYGFYVLLGRSSGSGRRKRLLAGALVLDVGILFYYKYFNFFLENVNGIFGRNFALTSILLPLGISFFTFQQLSFVIDAYKGEVPAYRFLDYACFVTYFPQLIAGPIVTHDELIPQFMDEERKRFRWDNFVRGIYLFVLGLSKKVLIADTFGNGVNWGFANIGELDSTNGFLVMLFYTIQIYFDFSGYCDMAVGLGRMMNLELPLNFHSPYRAASITEFWERWHMTLTRFFTRYVYIPLGGSRKGTVRTCRNVMLVFLVSGLWHGADWTFVLWGACHGVCSVLTRLCKGTLERIPQAVRWLGTFLFLNVTWVLFRADSIGDAARLLGKLLELDFGPVNGSLTAGFYLPECGLLDSLIPFTRICPEFFLIVFTAAALFLLFGVRNAYEKMKAFEPELGRLLLTALLLVWCICSFSGVSTFLYFNF